MRDCVQYSCVRKHMISGDTLHEQITLGSHVRDQDCGENENNEDNVVLMGREVVVPTWSEAPKSPSGVDRVLLGTGFTSNTKYRQAEFESPGNQ